MTGKQLVHIPDYIQFFLTVLIYFLVFLFASMYTKLKVIFSLTGGVMGNILSFIFPSIFYLYFFRKKGFTKYAFVAHSELNAILNYRGGNLEGAKIYVSLFPCNECAKAIIQCGIKEVIYDSDKYNNTPTNIAAKKMFEAAGVKCTQYKKTGRKIVIEV